MNRVVSNLLRIKSGQHCKFLPRKSNLKKNKPNFLRPIFMSKPNKPFFAENGAHMKPFSGLTSSQQRGNNRHMVCTGSCINNNKPTVVINIFRTQIKK